MSVQQVADGQIHPEVPINENMAALGQAFLWTHDVTADTGLVVALNGGTLNGNIVLDGTVTCTDGATNYIVANRSTRVLSVATTTTNWNAVATYGRIARAVFAAGVLTFYDERYGSGGVFDVSASGAVLGDGDYGDIVVSSSGTAINIDSAVLSTYGRTLIIAVDAAAARVVLGLVIGTNVQAYDAELAALAGLTSAADLIPYFTGSGAASTLTRDTDGTLAANSDLRIATQKAVKTAIAAAVAAALLADGDYGDIVVSSSGTAINIDSAVLSTYGRSLIIAANAAAARTTLGLVIGTDVQAYDAELAALAALVSAADKIPYFTGSGAAALLTRDIDGTMAANSDLVLATQKAIRTYIASAISGLGSGSVTHTGGALTAHAVVVGAGGSDEGVVAVMTDGQLLVGQTGADPSPETMSGDATLAASGALTIAALAVTYAKMQNISATQRVLARNSSGAGSTEEVQITTLLDWLSSTRGALLYRGASAWAALTPGTSGQVMQSQGAGADPLWVSEPYDLYVFLPGLQTSASQKLFRAKVARAITFPANFSTSYFGASANATGSTVLTMLKNGSSVGTVTIGAGTTTATFATSGGAAVSFAAGDLLEVDGPATADTTLADMGVTFVGTR